MPRGTLRSALFTYIAPSDAELVGELGYRFKIRHDDTQQDVGLIVLKEW